MKCSLCGRFSGEAFEQGECIRRGSDTCISEAVRVRAVLEHENLRLRKSLDAARAERDVILESYNDKCRQLADEKTHHGITRAEPEAEKGRGLSRIQAATSADLFDDSGE